MTNASAEGRSASGKAFLVRFVVLLVLFFGLIAPKPLDRAIVTPFTGFVASAGSAVCRLLGEDTRVSGTTLASPRFAVEIKNGCNGLETMLIFAAGVLAFPASARARVLGLSVGLVLISLVNLVRVVSLFFIGIRWPSLFEKTHFVVWQVLVILFGVALFLAWADRYAPAARPKPAP